VIDTTFLAVSSLILLSGYTVMGRGNLVRLQQQTHKSWALLEQPLRQRDTALSQLEPLCRQWLPRECDALERMLGARAELASAFQGFDVPAFGRAEALLREELGRLLEASETLPDQGALAQFRQLAERILALETRLTERGRVYNSAVDFHNMQIKQFPYLLLAHIMGFRAFERLDSATWKKTAPAAALL
jgi:LemA protein